MDISSTAVYGYLVFIDHQGNEAQIHQKLDNLLAQLMRCLSGNPDNLTFLYPADMADATERRPEPSGKRESSQYIERNGRRAHHPPT